MKYSIVVNKHK